MAVSEIWRFGSRASGLASPWREYNFLGWKAGHAMDRHGHDFLQTIHVLEGCLEVDWGEGVREVRAGEVHLLPPGRSHRLRTAAGHAQFGVNFSRRPDERGLLNALLEAFPEPDVRRLPFREVWRRELSRPAPTRAGRFRVLGALDSYALALLETAEAVGGGPGPLLDFLRDHVADGLSVEEIAAAMSTSRASLQRLAGRHFGCGAAHLYERVRMDRGAELLLGTELQVSECAAECGYADVYHFSRAFKRVLGVSPTAWRRERRRTSG